VALIYPSGADITIVTNTGLESNDMTFVGTSIAGVAQQTDYSDIKAGIVGNPGAIGGVTAATSAIIAGDLDIQDPTEASGGMTIQTSTASSGTLTGATDTIEVNIPSGAVILACQLRVDVAVTDSAGDDTWSAAYSGGATQSIVAGAAAAQNTKVNKFFDANAATAIASSEVDITLTPNGGNFTAGEITAVAYYFELTALANA
jgi:hypothetical protein